MRPSGLKPRLQTCHSFSDSIRTVRLAVSTQTMPELPAVTSVLPSGLSTEVVAPMLAELTVAIFAVRTIWGENWLDVSTWATMPVAPLTAYSRDPSRLIASDH